MTRSIAPGAVVSRVWALYQREAGTLLPIALVLFAIEFLIAILLPIALGAIVLIVFWVLVLLYQAFVVELVAADESGRRASQSELFSAVTPVLGPLIGISILFAIGVAIGFVLIIIPGLILLTIWSVVIPVEVLERRGVFASFGRSRELVKGNGWNVFGVIVIIWVLALVISFLAAALSAALGHVGRELVQWAVNVLLAPVVALSATVLYLELRAAHGENETPSTPV